MAEKTLSKPHRRRPNFPLAFKMSLVEQSLQPGASNVKLARDNGINDNLLFNWRQLYRRGKLGIQSKAGEPALVVVTVTDGPTPKNQLRLNTSSIECSICEVEFTGARLRLSGNVTGALLRALIQELKGPQA